MMLPSLQGEIILENEEYKTCFCLMKNMASKLKSGIEQRDAAIKMNGSGATCLVYNGSHLRFPSSSSSQEEKDLILTEKVQNYFKTKIMDFNVELEKDDVIIIGFGDNFETARLSTLSAALTLI